MIHARTWTKLEAAFARSKNLRFTLERSRGAQGSQWQAVLATEPGRVIGRATAGDPEPAVNQMLETADWGKIDPPRILTKAGHEVGFNYTGGYGRTIGCSRCGSASMTVPTETDEQAIEQFDVSPCNPTQAASRTQKD